MKKLIIYILATFLPLTAYGAFAVPWNATSTTQGWVQPGLLNGVNQTVIAQNYIATSSTATSTGYNGWDLQNGCFSIKGTCVGGSSTLPGGTDRELQYNNSSAFGGAVIDYTTTASTQTLTPEDKATGWNFTLKAGVGSSNNGGNAVLQGGDANGGSSGSKITASGGLNSGNGNSITLSPSTFNGSGTTNGFVKIQTLGNTGILTLDIDSLTTGRTLYFPDETGTTTLGTGVTGNCAQWSDTNTLTAASNPCSSGGGSFPFTAATNFNQNVNATTGIVWFKNGLQASSTSQFVNATATAITLLGNLFDSTSAAGTAGQILMSTNTGTKWVASTTFASPLTYLNGQVSCSTCNTSSASVSSITLGGGLDGATPITTTGTIIAQLATSSVPSIGQIAMFTGAGTPTTEAGISTTTYNLPSPLSGSFTTFGPSTAASFGTLLVGNGGTGATTFSQGWINSPGGTTALSASTSPTVAWITATSTTATSTFYGFITASRLDSSGTATNTASQGWNITAGCYAFQGSCIGGGSSLPTPVSVANGGTGAGSWGQGWFGVNNTGAFLSSTSPTIAWLYATSTTATSTFQAPLTISTTSQTAFLITDQFKTSVVSVNTASTTGPILNVIATNTPATLFSVDQYGHLLASSTPGSPTLSCSPTNNGTIAASSNDAVGDITTGTLSTSCTVTFNTPYTVTPEVMVTGGNTASVLAITSRSTTAFTVALGTAETGDNISYFVIQP